MNMTRGTAPVILALLIAATAATAPGALAQTADDTAATPPSPSPTPSGAGADSATSSNNSAAARSSPGDDSPFDYRSSEKISEDLSVSFPVDI